MAVPFVSKRFPGVMSFILVGIVARHNGEPIAQLL
jgi:hypothetical protein